MNLIMWDDEVCIYYSLRVFYNYSYIIFLSILTWLFLSKEKTSTSCDLLTFLIENHNSNPPTPNYRIIFKKITKVSFIMNLIMQNSLLCEMVVYAFTVF